MNNDIVQNANHWADVWADKIIRQYPNHEVYTCAAGITPSGTIHIGNFREIISVALVVKALKQKGKKVRFLYSWDDYDVFRKVPDNMPQRELLENYLRCPITLVPDVFGDEESYAMHNAKEIMAILPQLGIEPEYIYQSKEYQASRYSQQIKEVLQKKEQIRAILNEFRSRDLEADWWPVSAFCGNCHKDTITFTNYDGEDNISYSCSSCSHQETVNIHQASNIKLPWRIDWPMRWKEEQVIFEPAGKDHHSEGGSFDTAAKIVTEVFNFPPPLSFQYDFIRIKGGQGKISSSSGDVLSLKDVLNVYQPDVLLSLFVSTRPNSEFAISFDLDVIKNYEDYDKLERDYYQKPEGEKALKKWYKRARIYELTQINHDIPAVMPYQIAFRHLCNLLQTCDCDFEQLWQRFGNGNDEDKLRLKKRAECTLFWLENYAEDDFVYKISTAKKQDKEFSTEEKNWLESLIKTLRSLNSDADSKVINDAIYVVMHDFDQSPDTFFPFIYQILISKSKGPKLGYFIQYIGIERTCSILQSQLE